MGPERLRRRIDVLKKPTIECGKSGLDIEVQPFLDRFFGKKGREARKVFLSYPHKHLKAAQRLKTALAVQQNNGRIDFWYDTKGFLKGKADVTVFGMK